MLKDSFRLRRHSGEGRNPRLHGRRAFGELSGSTELTEDQAVLERRLEQAAEEGGGVGPITLAGLAGISLVVMPARREWIV